MKPREDLREFVEAMWADRAASRYADLNRRSARYRQLQTEFFCGAMAGISAAAPDPNDDDLMSPLVPMEWLLNILAGMAPEERRHE